MPPFQPFTLERVQSEWENVVEYNLTESGVHPISVRELVGDGSVLDELLSMPLGYPQTNGTIELRERIAALYPGATPDNVLVTIGCAEANFTALQTLLAPGDEMVVMLPNYMQIWGIGQNYGYKVKTFSLREERGWAPDLAALDEMVTERTKLIAVCNPNNPTGYILKPAEMDAIVAAAARAGAWLLADEVYRGAEQRTDVETPSFWGRYDKVLALNSLSKAYGLPGLRIGWAVAPADTAAAMWARRDYFTISATMLANKLAAFALSPEVRPRLIRRTRDYIRAGMPIADEWLRRHPGTFDLVPPQAAAIIFARYHLDINSTDLVDRLRREKDVLVVPGDCFGLDHHLRIGIGSPAPYLRAGLERVHELLAELQR